MSTSVASADNSPTLTANQSVVFSVTGTAMPAARLCPDTGKRMFRTEAEALEFEARNRERHDNAQQYVYRCDECGEHHLTCKPRGTGTMARVNYSELGNYATKRHRHRLTGDEVEQISALRAQGMTVQAIAERLELKANTVANRLSKLRTATQTEKAMTVESYEDQEKQLQDRLRIVQEAKKRLIEAKALKVQFCWGGDGILISKEGRHIDLALDDCRELTMKLEELLTTPEAVAPYAPAAAA